MNIKSEQINVDTNAQLIEEQQEDGTKIIHKSVDNINLRKMRRAYKFHRAMEI